jgi:hypothetical protein
MTFFLAHPLHLIGILKDINNSLLPVIKIGFSRLEHTVYKTEGRILDIEKGNQGPL